MPFSSFQNSRSEQIHTYTQKSSSNSDTMFEQIHTYIDMPLRNAKTNLITKMRILLKRRRNAYF